MLVHASSAFKNGVTVDPSCAFRCSTTSCDTRHVVLLAGIDSRWLETVKQGGRECLHGFAAQMADVGRAPAQPRAVPGSRRSASVHFSHRLRALLTEVVRVEIGPHFTLEALHWLADPLLGFFVVIETAGSDIENESVAKNEMSPACLSVSTSPTAHSSRCFGNPANPACMTCAGRRVP